jgi:hypothetical protein
MQIFQTPQAVTVPTARDQSGEIIMLLTLYGCTETWLMLHCFNIIAKQSVMFVIPNPQRLPYPNP